MSDNIQLNLPTTSGKTVASLDDGTAQHEKVIAEFLNAGGAPVMVSAANPLPVLATIDTTGLATSANQTTEISGLAAILAKLSSDPATQTTLAAILAKLISNPATDTLQTTGNTSLASIKTNTDKIPSLGQALAASSVPVVLTAAEEAIFSALLTTSDFDTKTGSLTETAPATDTASSGVNGRLQRIAQRLTSLIAAVGSPFQAGGSIGNSSFASTIADGADVTLGAIADAIVAAGATGSLSAKLRRVTQGLEDLKTLIVLAAGSAIIGKVGIDQTTPGTTNAVKATNFPTTADTNSGTSSASTLRVVLATDQPALTNPQPVKATQKPSYGADVAMTITNLSSLASSATAGWQSARVSNLATLATDYLISVKATMANTAAANDKAIYVYALPWYTNDAGSTWFVSDGGTATLPSGSEGTYTIASPNNMRLLGILNYTTTQQVCQNNFLLSNAFGNRMPHGWSLVIINFSGAALAATSGSNNLVEYAPMNDVLV